MSLAAPAVPARPRWRRTQVGRFTLALDLVLLLLLGAPAVATGSIALWLGVAVVLLVGVFFSTLTVEVREDAVRLWFGPGVLRRTIPFVEVASAAIAPSPWWHGIGLRLTPTGMMYNVAVGRTVDLELRSGRRLRIGTDRPEELLAAVQAGIARVTPGAPAR